MLDKTNANPAVAATLVFMNAPLAERHDPNPAQVKCMQALNPSTTLRERSPRVIRRLQFRKFRSDRILVRQRGLRNWHMYQ